MKKYLETTTAKKLQVETFYDKGGISFFTGQVAPRGYWLSVKPVEIKDGMISFALFTGFKALLLEVKRASPKAEQEAEKIAAQKEPELVQAVLKKFNLALAGAPAPEPVAWLNEKA